MTEPVSPFTYPSATQTVLAQRARIIKAIRCFFDNAGFLEVETPIRIPAPIPEAHIDIQTSDGWALQPSPELCMKRLLAAGHKKIYQICRCFRKGERGRRHVPEMTLLEWYAAGYTYLDLMAQCEDLIGFMAEKMGLGDQLVFQGHTVNLTPPWDRLTVDAAFQQFSGMSAEAALDQDCFDEEMGLVIEPRLGLQRPVFLYDYPIRCGSLARASRKSPGVAERFELYMAGMELCNAFSELVDPVEQRHRFEAANQIREASGKPVFPLPERFLADLAHMPEAAGNALGLDRLVMLLCNAPSIDDVIAFFPESL
ncbi:EF-P lysine aminoacylase GenX [Desulfosarcina sp. OttesenSCG-928-A07]|nr:EF-P lysine aminoacylase GenX [Desulfosarcina sp. OttesenSCG-928-G17]MDL2330044.1 EF-P lysine aminoacylase GenX [Desulfosarcina sp. OttesenSCG-928-A07]